MEPSFSDSDFSVLLLSLRRHSDVRSASQLGRPCIDERTTTLIRQTLAGRFAGLPDLVVRWLGCGTESLIKVRGEPQVVGRKQPHHRFVQPSGRRVRAPCQQAPRAAGGCASPARRSPQATAPAGATRRTSFNINMRSMRADNPPAIRSVPAGTSTRPRSIAASTSESVTIWPGRMASTRSIISALTLTLRAEAESRRAESKEPGRVYVARRLLSASALRSLLCLRQFHQNACPRLMCNAVRRSRSLSAALVADRA